MDEKLDQTVAMLNEENHPPRTRINDNRAPLTKVIYIKKYQVLCYPFFFLVLFKCY